MGLKPTCREVHRLTSEALDRNLSPVEHIRMRAHFLVCRACRNFSRQLDAIRHAMKKFVPSDPTLPDQEK
jgi:predicted anti-sigma-YlaC factor YlaD